jgi:hypothetical protein
MKSPLKMLLAMAGVAALAATPAFAKPLVNQARVSHVPIPDNSTFVTESTHGFGIDREPTLRFGAPRDGQVGSPK